MIIIISHIVIIIVIRIGIVAKSTSDIHIKEMQEPRTNCSACQEVSVGANAGGCVNPKGVSYLGSEMLIALASAMQVQIRHIYMYNMYVYIYIYIHTCIIHMIIVHILYI